MNDNAKKWVAALRSGDYEQTDQYLTRISPTGAFTLGHCCLGVLCELAVEHEVIADFNADDGNLDPYPEVQRWAGLEEAEGRCDGGRSLVHLNDGNAATPSNDFKAIAAVILAEPEGMFVDG